MNLLYLGNFFRSDRGVYPYCAELADMLTQTGCDVRTASSIHRKELRLTDMMVKLLLHGRSTDAVIVDVFSGYSFLWFQLTSLVCALLRLRCIALLHGGNLPHYALRFPRRVTRALRRCDAVVAPSPYLQTALRDYRDDIRVIGNALDVGVYRYRERGSPLRRAVWIRHFHHIYQPEFVPAVVRLLRTAGQSVQVDMFGADSGDGSLQRTKDLASSLGVMDLIRFQDAVDKTSVPALLADYDLYVNTSLVDNTPIIVLEAMATGLCVVSTDSGGLPYLLTNEQDALLVPARQPEQFAEAIIRLRQDPALAVHLSRNARLKAEAHDWSRIIQEWLALLGSREEPVADPHATVQ
jgi:glycosyltransferase involved in cell wall biosynthesis